MSADDLERCLRAFAARRPFRSFQVEFHSGDRFRVSHPEVVWRSGELFVYSGPDRSHRIFSATSISQIVDPPVLPPTGDS